ncbi:unnamed protein product [Umbelopsis vinacea]
MGGWETLVEATDQQGANEDETSKDASERVHAISQRAVAILRRALNHDAIIFELPKSAMSVDLLVEEIEQQTCPIVGFTNLGQYRRDITDLSLEIVFM